MGQKAFIAYLLSPRITSLSPSSALYQYRLMTYLNGNDAGFI
uniref:Bm14108 n=1 Tax=Brugia malayi TaxID=6279 RepID=A0A1I9FZX2_BRUMA|nr:Bm14108 [Brugia malayi]